MGLVTRKKKKFPKLAFLGAAKFYCALSLVRGKCSTFEEQRAIRCFKNSGFRAILS